MDALDLVAAILLEFVYLEMAIAANHILLTKTLRRQHAQVM
jgi:hypothetical protein